MAGSRRIVSLRMEHGASCHSLNAAPHHTLRFEPIVPRFHHRASQSLPTNRTLPRYGMPAGNLLHEPKGFKEQPTKRENTRHFESPIARHSSSRIVPLSMTYSPTPGTALRSMSAICGWQVKYKS